MKQYDRQEEVYKKIRSYLIDRACRLTRVEDDMVKVNAILAPILDALNAFLKSDTAIAKQMLKEYASSSDTTPEEKSRIDNLIISIEEETERRKR